MRSLKLLLAGGLLLLVAAAAAAAPANTLLGVSAGHDLDALWARARTLYTPADHDAILLLESRQEAFAEDGTLTTRIHRVVWIGTAVGLHEHADLRIPWNSATSTLTVEKLRTWREGRWWPDAEKISGTAVVHTLPFALDRADDYTAMRETMLLHDGVEPPCILETAYTISERGLPGADGLFVFPQPDAAVLTVLEVTTPQDLPLPHQEINGAPAPTAAAAGGDRVLTWTREGTPALGRPHTAQPEALAPAVVWSTWSDWSALRSALCSRFDQATVLPAALADTLRDRLDGTPDRLSEVLAIVALVDEGVRDVGYPDQAWRFAPRPAARTWDTAYGHGLDRAVLAAALLRSAGLTAIPTFVGEGTAVVAPEVPRLAGLGDLRLTIPGLAGDCLYDPAAGTLVGGAALVGHPVWRTDQYLTPLTAVSPLPNQLFVQITLEPGADGAWTGDVYCDWGGLFSPHRELAGRDGELQRGLAAALTAILPEAVLTDATPGVFHPFQVTAGGAFTLAAIAPDAEGMIRLELADPANGILGRLPGVRLFDAARETAVRLPAPLEQTVVLRLRTGDRAVRQLPTAAVLDNAAGSFRLTVAEAAGLVTVTRTLALTAAEIAPAEWPALRALLLEEADPGHRLVVLQ